MKTLLPVQMLWVGGALSNLEKLSITSFLANGHDVHLYSYDLHGDMPTGTTLIDAAEIMDPVERFAMNTNVGYGSVTPFSNRFRYKLLHERGGVWCDTDVVLLKPLSFLEEQEYWFCSEYGMEKDEGNKLTTRTKIASCFLKVPKGSVVMQDCFERAMSTDLTTAEWAATGPQLLDNVVSRHGLEKSVLQPNAICPLPFWETAKLLSGMYTLPSDSYAIHFYNEMFRRNFFDKNAAYPDFCIYERLKSHYFAKEH